MQTIQTKYLGYTNFRGSRIRATVECGYSIIRKFDPKLNNEQNHDAACLALAEKLKWEGDFIRGGTKEGFVYVFAKDFKLKNPYKAKRG